MTWQPDNAAPYGGRRSRELLKLFHCGLVAIHAVCAAEATIVRWPILR